jgi:cell division protein FtsW (lipid II flippase)
LGWIGTTAVVLAWILILIRGMRIARNAPDRYRFMLAAGLTLNLVLFAVVNAAVVTAMVPVTGQGMPFISYGGGGMLMNFFSIGVLDAINRSTA